MFWFPFSPFQTTLLISPAVIRSQAPKVAQSQARERRRRGGKMKNSALREERKVAIEAAL